MRRICFLLFLLLLPAPVAAQTLEITSALPADITDSLVETFRQQSGVAVTTRRENTGSIVERLSDDGFLESDILLTTDVMSLLRLKELGYLQPAFADRFPAYLRGEDRLWVAISASVRLMIYDKDRVRKVPENYRDLAEPAYHNALCLSPSRRAGNITLVANSTARMGLRAVENWLAGMAGNQSITPLGHDYDQLYALRNGECFVSLISSDLYFRLLNSGTAGERQLLNGLSVVAPGQPNLDFTFAAIFAGAQNIDVANIFIEFLASDAAQRLLYQTYHQIPVMQADQDNVTLSLFQEPIVLSTHAFLPHSRSYDAALLLLSKTSWQ